MNSLLVNKTLFNDLLGWNTNEAELEEKLIYLKVELIKAKKDDLPKNDLWSFQATDAGRPDLLSTAGLARQLRILLTSKIPGYPFFLPEPESFLSCPRAVVDSSAKKMPYLAGFVITGKPINQLVLNDFFHSKEQLCDFFEKRGQKLAVQLMDSDSIKWPIVYKSSESDKKRSELIDSSGKNLFNKESEYIASLLALADGSSRVFIQIQADDLLSAAIAANILACDFADMAYKIEVLKVDYSYITDFGRSVFFPYYWQKAISIDSSKLSALLGESISPIAAAAALQKTGIAAETHGQHIRAWPPEYRADLKEANDLLEEVMIGKAFSGHSMQKAKTFAMGKLSGLEQLNRKVKDIMISYGYKEMLHSYFAAKEKFAFYLHSTIEFSLAFPVNAKRKNTALRPGILPCLLNTEGASAQRTYPHKIFETGKVFYNDYSEDLAENLSEDKAIVICKEQLGILLCHQEACFAELAGLLASLCFVFGKKFNLYYSNRVWLKPDRQAEIMIDSKPAGIIGEVSSTVLDSLKIKVPCVACELDMDFLE